MPRLRLVLCSLSLSSVPRREGRRLGEEGVDAKKLLDKAPSCGTSDERTLVEKTKHVTVLAVHHAVEKIVSGCSLKKVGDTV